MRRSIRAIRLAMVCVTLLIIQACASNAPLVPKYAPGGPSSHCAQWLEKVDALVAERGVIDAQDARIAGFPYARTSRLLASWRTELSTDDPRFDDWARLLEDRGVEGLLLEWQRLAADDQQALTEEAFSRGLPTSDGGTLIRQCAKALGEQDRSVPERRQALLARAVVPDAYIDWQRWVGLYPLTRWPFAAGVRRWQEQTRAVFDAQSALPAKHFSAWHRYMPVMADVATSGSTVQSSQTSWSTNALGMPVPDRKTIDRLFARHAPVLLINGNDPNDIPGAVDVSAGHGPLVSMAKSRAYTRLSHTRWGGRVLLQLNYLFWFAARPADSPLDLLAGRFDGLVWRVTLDEHGQPLVYDTIHACGCYHEFFATPSVWPRDAPPDEQGNEWVFLPASAPILGPDDRIHLYVQPGTHYLQRVDALPLSREHAGPLRRYDMSPEDDLRSLHDPVSGRRVSLYGPDGLVPGSQRLERWLFWPMGVPSAGAQRQWGQHATAFVGRRHFDDPLLFEQRFDRLTGTVGAP